MDGLTKRFLEYELQELKQSPRTVESYANRLRSLEKFMGKPWSEVTSDDMRAFKRDSHYSSQTISGIIVAWRQGRYWGSLEGLWELNGERHVKVPRVENVSHQPLPASAIRTLLTNCQTPLEYRLIYLGLFGGLRVSESARIGEEEWEEGVLRFVGAKTRKVREVPIHGELELARAAIMCSPSETVVQNLHRARREMSKRLKVDFSPHRLRSSFATALEEKGVAWEVISALLGHSLGVTARYASISLKRKREAIDALDYA